MKWVTTSWTEGINVLFDAIITNFLLIQYKNICKLLSLLDIRLLRIYCILYEWGHDFLDIQYSIKSLLKNCLTIYQE